MGIVKTSGITFLAVAAMVGAAHAHGISSTHNQNADHDHSHGETDTVIETLSNALAPSAVANSSVSITLQGGRRIIISNGLPDHATGRFPNRNNPHGITTQNHRYEMPANPQRAGGITPLGLHPFGVALNGIPFDPGAAEFWNRNRQSGWQYEAMGGGVNLGLDENNAHVQPSGAYHYHASPTALLQRFGYQAKPALLGFAADGFPIYADFHYANPNQASGQLVRLRSGYTLKPGSRSGGPRGRHDGTFVQDYEFTGRGDLDQCNGRTGVTPEFPQGTYYYVITAEFPFIPRCFVGAPDRSFMRFGPPPGGQGGERRGPPPRHGFGNRPPPPPGHRGPPPPPR